MKKYQTFFATIFLLVSLVFPAPLRAEEFVPLSFDNILKTFIRFGTLDLRYDEVMDLYGRVMVCDLYQEYYDNDFQWQRIRGVLRKSIKKEVGLFPTAYKYDTTLQLGKYDFENNIYLFSSGTIQFNVNVFNIETNAKGHCGRTPGLELPGPYNLVLDQPVRILGIPMTKKQGEIFLKRMEKEGNYDRLIYVRFNIKIVFVEPFLKEEIRSEEEAKLDYQKGRNKTKLSVQRKIRLDGQLDSIEYYEDEALTKMIYKYQP